MQLLEDMIVRHGKICEGDILRVGSFFNQQMDISLIMEMGKEFYRLFKDCHVSKILTIEASGIAIACTTAQSFNVPLVFAKKSSSANALGDAYTAEVRSYTRGSVFSVTLPKEYLSKDDNVLIIDDFLATGSAALGLVEIVRAAGASVAGIGIGIEKSYQEGAKKLRDTGCRVESLARIASMDIDKGFTFIH